MAISVAAGAPDAIVDFADGFVVQIREADDVEATLGALRALRRDVEALTPTPPLVSEPVVAPGGPAIRVVDLAVDLDVLVTVLDLAVKRLHDAGVLAAVVDVPEPGGELDGLDRCPSAVVLRAFPRPAGAAGVLPARWIDLAADWVLGGLPSTEAVPLRVLGLESRLPAADAPAVLHQAATARAWCDLVHGSLQERIRTASLTFGTTPHLALAAGGPGCDRSALLARFELLQELARVLAVDAAYVCIDVEDTFESIGLGLSPDGWAAEGGASANLVAGRLVDVLVPDAFPFQVLGPGHLERFVPGADMAALPLGDALGDDRIEVVVGEPEQWLLGPDERAEAHEEGLRLLAPLLATEAEVAELLVDRPVRPAVPASSSATGLPGLDEIHLETLPHPRRGLRLTFLELVAWLAGEPHSDAPTSVSPVLATFARWFASALDDERRQDLKPRAERLAGTAAPGPGEGGSAAPAPADLERAWRTTDWLIGVQAARWLRAAGLVEAAGRLEAAPSAREHEDLLGTVDVLSTALVIATRRIELTASVAADGHPGDADLVAEASWEAWEVASEAAGWVAASEAAAVGVPAELAYATDLRVIECARDPRLRAELEASGRTIGDATWAAAIRAVADAAWAAGWEAARRAEGSDVVELSTALDRARRAATARLDEPDLVLERADGAACERLAALVLRARSDHQHPWDAARDAAASSEGGALWSTVQDLARDAVGDRAWDVAMASARDAVDARFRTAPELVARAVVAALAKETASAAARGIAGRACAIARAQGADPLVAVDAAHDALAPVVESLQGAAFDLLDALIDP